MDLDAPAVESGVKPTALLPFILSTAIQPMAG